MGKDGMLSDAARAKYNADRDAWNAAHPRPARPYTPTPTHLRYPTMSGDVPGTDAGSSPLHKAVKNFCENNPIGQMLSGAMKMAPGGFSPTPPLGITPALHSQIDNSRRVGDISHSPVFNISGGDVKQNAEAARLMASRGYQDVLRNTQGALA